MNVCLKKDTLNKLKSVYLIKKNIILYCFSIVRLNKDVIKRRYLLYLLKVLDRITKLLLVTSIDSNSEITNEIKVRNSNFLHTHLVSLVKKYTRILHTNKVKNRSRLSYSKIKLWKQKGTGRARIGSKSSPTLRGGAVVFGPVGFINKKKMNKKLKKLLFVASVLYKINCFTIFELLKPKDLPYLKNKPILLLISNRNKEAFNMALEFKNYKNFTIKSLSMINSFDIIKHNVIIISENDLFELFNRFLI